MDKRIGNNGNQSADGPRCRLCASLNTEVIFRMNHADRIYTVVRCAICDVIQTVEHYESVSPTYVDLREDEIDTKRIWCQGEHKYVAFQQWLGQARQMIRTRNRSLRLLDIGCGTGGFLRYVQEYGFEVFGFDSSQAQVQYAHEYLPNVRRALGPSEYLGLLDRNDLRFDVVTMWDVFEHVRHPLEFLTDIQKIVVPGGLVYMSVPNGPAMVLKRQIKGLLRIWSDNDWAPWEHVFYYSIQSLTNYLSEIGFMVVDTGAVVAYPRPLSALELVRRIGFRIMEHVPSWAPQIYVWARVRESGVFENGA